MKKHLSFHPKWTIKLKLEKLRKLQSLDTAAHREQPQQGPTPQDSKSLYS